MGKKSSLNLFEHYDSRGKSSSSSGKRSFKKGLRKTSESEKNVARQESRQRRQEDKSMAKAHLQRSVRQQERTRKYSDLGEEDEQLVGRVEAKLAAAAQVSPTSVSEAQNFLSSSSFANAAATPSTSTSGVTAAKSTMPASAAAARRKQQQQHATEGHSSSLSSSSSSTTTTTTVAAPPVSSSSFSSALISDVKQELYVALFGPKRYKNFFAFDDSDEDEEDEAEISIGDKSSSSSSSNGDISCGKKAYQDSSVDEQVFYSLLPSTMMPPLVKPSMDEEASRSNASILMQQHRPRSFLAAASGKRDYYVDGLSLHPIELVHTHVSKATLRSLVFGLHGEDDRLPSARLSLLVSIFRLASSSSTTAFPAPTLAAHGASCELKRIISTLLAEATNSFADDLQREYTTDKKEVLAKATAESSSMKGTRGKRLDTCASSVYSNLFELLLSIANALVASSSPSSSPSFSAVVCMLMRAAAGGVRLLAAAASSAGAVRASINEQSSVVFASLQTLSHVADEVQKKDFLSYMQRNWPSKSILEEEVFIKTLAAVSSLLLSPPSLLTSFAAPLAHKSLDQSTPLPLVLSFPNSTRQKLIARLAIIVCGQASLCASAAIDLFSANLELAKQASTTLLVALHKNVSVPHWQLEIKSKSASLLQSIASA